MRESQEKVLYADYRKDCTIKLCEGGFVTVDYGTHGKTINVLNDQNHALQSKEPQQENTKVGRIQEYLYILFEAQKAGHDVHKEIDEALKQFKSEIGL